ncbi:MAG: DUF1573 domain-containing protein [Saprospiraceae bacterium]|nr:DUF1573 domain-containing protein [Saprospiraceae bacterium]
MKFLFVSLFFSALLIFAGEVYAQNPTNAPKVASKSTTPTSAASKAKSAPSSSVKKAKKPASSPKPASKGLFDDDYDGEVGIKYIGVEPASDEELSKVTEVQESERGTKTAKITPKKVVVAPVKQAETVTIEAPKVDVVSETPVIQTAVITEIQAEVKPIKPAVKPASKSTKRGAHAEFDVMTINMGTIKEDAVEERYFEFTNTGTTNLEILECRGSCGCTQPRAESSVVAPGERSKIYVKYVALNKVGPQRPVITLTTNGSPSVIRLFLEIWVDQIPGGVKDTISTPVKSEHN